MIKWRWKKKIERKNGIKKIIFYKKTNENLYENLKKKYTKKGDRKEKKRKKEKINI